MENPMENRGSTGKNSNCKCGSPKWPQLEAHSRQDRHPCHTCMQRTYTHTQNYHPDTHLFVSHGHILYVCVFVGVLRMCVCVFSFSNKLPSFPASPVNNMTDEQLQDWHTTFLSEAQRENYVNHNLEIVRHYRTEAIARAPAFDLERNAIDAAIARHGLYVSSANGDGSAAEGAVAAGSGSSSSGAGGGQDEVLPPPQRRPRIDDDPTCSTASTSSSYSGGRGGSGAATTSSSATSSSTPGTASNYGHFVALQHIFDSYATRAEPPRALGAAFSARPGAAAPTANGNGKDHSEDASGAAAAAAGGANVSDMAISKTIDSMGLRRSH